MDNMNTIITALRQAIQMTRENAGDTDYVQRRLDEITWGVDALEAVVDAAQAFVVKYDFWMEYVEHAAHPYVCTYCHTASDNPHRLDTHPHASDCPAKLIIDALAKLPGYK